jgi:hypothetical protein
MLRKESYCTLLSNSRKQHANSLKNSDKYPFEIIRRGTSHLFRGTKYVVVAGRMKIRLFACG